MHGAGCNVTSGSGFVLGKNNSTSPLDFMARDYRTHGNMTVLFFLTTSFQVYSYAQFISARVNKYMASNFTTEVGKLIILLRSEIVEENKASCPPGLSMQ